MRLVWYHSEVFLWSQHICCSTYQKLKSANVEKPCMQILSPLENLRKKCEFYFVTPFFTAGVLGSPRSTAQVSEATRPEAASLEGYSVGKPARPEAENSTPACAGARFPASLKYREWGIAIPTFQELGKHLVQLWAVDLGDPSRRTT